MEQKTQIATKEERAVVQFKGEPITITFNDVRNYICPLASDQEVVIFLKTCQSLNLNPWASECFLIKYTERDKAATVIALDAYLKSAELNPNFDGYEAGIILKDASGKLEFREGAFLLDEERPKLVGGFARVYRKDKSRPYYVAVNQRECIRFTKDGRLTQFWSEERQPWMLRKVALKRALVEAFATLFAGTISTVEADYEVLPEEVKEILPQPKGETPEGELPSAFVKDGQADWSKFWAHQAEKGIDGKRAHQLLKVNSVKVDLFELGKTLEEIDEMLNLALNAEKKTITPKAEETPAENFISTITSESEIPESPTLSKPKRDPATIKTLNDLLKVSFLDFGLQPKEIYAELNVSSPNEIAEIPSECYIKIAAARGIQCHK